MKFVSAYRSRKYLQKISISISLLIALTLSLTSLTLYHYSEKIVQEIQYDANKKVLSQVNYNIGFLGKMIDSLAYNLFMDNDFIPLLYGDGMNTFDLVNKSGKLDKWVNSNSYVHSVIMYNGRADRIFAGGNIDIQYEKALDDQYRSFLRYTPSIQKASLVPMTLPLSGQRTDVFSYILYDKVGAYQPGDSAMFVNVKPDWLFDNIRRLNGLGTEVPGQIVVLDRDDRPFSSDRREASLDPDLKAKLKERGGNGSSEPGFFETQIGGEPYMVTYMPSDAFGWTIVSLQPYDAIFYKIDRWKSFTLLLSGLFFLVSIALSVLVSHRLYRPIENLINQVRRTGPLGPEEEIVGAKDELAFLSETYRRIVDKSEVERKRFQADPNVVKNYNLRRLLADSAAISGKELAEQIEHNGLRLKPDSPMVCCILSIDHYWQFERSAQQAEKRLYAFAVMNIAEEVLSRHYLCESVDMRSGHFVIIVSGASSAAGMEERIAGALKEILQIVKSYYQLSLSASVSPVFSRYEELHRSYELAQQILHYRMVFGHHSVITYDMVQARLENRDFQLPADLEKKLGDSMRSGQADAFEETLHKLFQHISKLHPDMIYHSLLLLLTSLKQAVNGLNANKLSPVSIDWSTIQKQLLEKETLDDMTAELLEVFRSIEGQREDADYSKNKILVDTIKEFIEDHYQDPNLSLQGIASMLKMSSAHVGKLFKLSEQLSVAEYITEIRLSHTALLLESTDRSVSDVMEKVGFMNRSNFYKLFKNKYGVTPNEYRLKKTIY
ncbi:helix-turn-helix domain-containing protein [Paenibacillus silviterrae]|uniref:helix-turn-helix domain-containing protein n=1 Tax=Paenibacillus silviterrae TaxID=3242194 RepID=UPI002543EE34|nr:helix-turn-helix domain-containing protein [Paenibacillus chinjuensis]